MRKIATIALLGLLGALPASLAPAGEGVASCPAPHVTDGDTLRCGDVRVRLHGIDAPEMDAPAGAPSRDALAAAVGAGPLFCEDTGGRTYGRVVAICRRPDGLDVGEAVIRAGWARDWPTFSGGRYAPAEAEARTRRRGMWR